MRSCPCLTALSGTLSLSDLKCSTVPAWPLQLLAFCLNRGPLAPRSGARLSLHQFITLCLCPLMVSSAPHTPAPASTASSATLKGVGEAAAAGAAGSGTASPPSPHPGLTQSQVLVSLARKLVALSAICGLTRLLQAQVRQHMVAHATLGTASMPAGASFFLNAATALAGLPQPNAAAAAHGSLTAVWFSWAGAAVGSCARRALLAVGMYCAFAGGGRRHDAHVATLEQVQGYEYELGG